MSLTVVLLYSLVIVPMTVRLSAGAASTLNDLKTQTRAGLEHAINQRKVSEEETRVSQP